jgi:hypothetical protein
VLLVYVGGWRSVVVGVCVWLAQYFGCMCVVGAVLWVCFGWLAQCCGSMWEVGAVLLVYVGGWRSVVVGVCVWVAQCWCMYVCGWRSVVGVFWVVGAVLLLVYVGG